MSSAAAAAAAVAAGVTADSLVTDALQSLGLGPVPANSMRVLYRDALQCVFVFFALPELSRISSVSREWRQTLFTMPAGNAVWPAQAKALDWRQKEKLHNLLESTLRRAVREIRFTVLYEKFANLQSLQSASLSSSSLRLISHALPHLASLSVRLDLSGTAPDEVVLDFPPGLREASFVLEHAPGSRVVAPRLEAFARDLARSSPALRKLRALNSGLGASSNPWPGSVLGCLVPLSSLEELVLPDACAGPYPAECWPPLRRMKALRVLDLHSGVSGRELDEFTSSPLEGALEEVGLFDKGLKGEHVAGLLRLPTIQRLGNSTRGLVYFTVAQPEFLARMSSLTEVHLQCTEGVDATEFVASLGQCEKMRILHLTHPSIDSDLLERLVTALPELADIHLIWMPKIKSLAFLALPAVACRLTSLNFETMELPRSEISVFLEVSALRSLRLSTAFSSPQPDASSVDLLRPTHATFQKHKLPFLEKLVYTAPMPYLGKPHGRNNQPDLL